MHTSTIIRITIYTCLLIPYVCIGQVSSFFGRFQVEYTRGCAPFTVNLTETDDFGNISRTYTYEAGAPSTSDTFHTYQQPGRYEIIQLLGEDIVPKTDTLIIEVLENSPVAFDLFVCDANQALISLPDSVYDRYELALNNDSSFLDENSAFSQIITFRDSLDLKIRGLYQDASSNCQVLDTTLIREVSAAISNLSVEYDFQCVDLFSANVSFEGNRDQLYRVTFNDGSGTSVRTLTTGWDQSVIRVDSIAVENGNDQLCLEVDAISACDGSIFESESICQNIQQLNTPITFGYASFEGDSVIINIDSRGGELSLGRLTENKNQFLQNFQSNQLKLLFNDTQQPVYIITSSSACLEDSIAFAIAPPFISTRQLSVNHYEISYDSSQFFSSTNEVLTAQYFLFNATDSLSLDPDIRDFRLDLSNGDQQVLIRSENLGAFTLSSNTVAINYEYIVYVPEAFTPNGDGINDRLELFGLPTENFQLKIFNRWGELIFETNELNNWWNGQLSNGNVVESTYVYRLIFYNRLGELFTQQGSFAIIRD